MTYPRIDVHAHFLPGFYREALFAAGQQHPDGMPSVPEWSSDRALGIMDKLGIAFAILSISSPGVHFGNDEAAAQLSRRINKEGARLGAAHPHRFGLFAVTPLPNVQLAAEEAAYALDRLGAYGVVVESNHHGLYQGDRRLDPFYAELDRRGAALFIHPTSPSCEGCLTLSLGRPRPLLEFMFETTRTVSNLILTGTLERFPRMRVLVPHAGAALPVLASRLQSQAALLPKEEAERAARMKDNLRKLYFDLAGAPLPELLQALDQIAAPDRIFYGSDWPFTPDASVEQLAAALDATPLLNEMRRKAYMYENALAAFPSLGRQLPELASPAVPS